MTEEKRVTREEAIAAAGRVLADGIAEQLSRTPNEAAEAAYVPGGPSVDELEDRIRAQRGLPPKGSKPDTSQRHETSVDLDDTTRCPLAHRCDRCGGDATPLAAITATSALGVHCVTLCSVCRKRSALPKAPPTVVARMVGQHCTHLGIDLDQMAAAMEVRDA